MLLLLLPPPTTTTKAFSSSLWKGRRLFSGSLATSWASLLASSAAATEREPAQMKAGAGFRRGAFRFRGATEAIPWLLLRVFFFLGRLSFSFFSARRGETKETGERCVP